MRVTLTWSELVQAANVGVLRQATNIRDGRQDAYGLSKKVDPWGIHIRGCCGELAAAKALNVFWTGSHGKLRAPDVGGKYGVRTIEKPTHCLMLHPEDPDTMPFILALGTMPTYSLVGWILAGAGKQSQYWKDPTGEDRPAFFVPRLVLLPMAQLPK